MLTLPGTVRIFLCARPVDLRKSFDGLAVATREIIGEDPLCGHVFVFLNRRGDRAKLLLWDRNGYLLVYNHLSSHYTSFDSRRGSWSPLRDAPSAAARSQSRSHRLQCFAGWVAGSS